MTNDAPAAPAGWYPDPDGKQRYWDGERWLDIEAPTTVPSTDADGTDIEPRRPRRRRLGLWAGIAVVALILIGGGTVLAIKVQNDQAAAAAQAEKEAEEEAAEAEQAKADAAAERQAAADELEREQRSLSVDEIETSIKTMAEGHVTEGIIDGPIIEVSCDPLDGGSTDDLTQKTTVFQCFVANEDNGDGTLSGYYYNATMNWDSGQYTYGFGQP